MKRLPNPLRAFRESLGLSREAMARAIGKSTVTLEKYEAEAPVSLLEALENHAKSIGREDAIPILHGLPSNGVIRLPAKDPVRNITDGTEPGSLLSPSHLGLDEAEIVRLQQIARRVLTHPKPGLGIALKTNLEQFDDAADLWERLNNAGDIGAGEPERAKTIDESIDEAARYSERVRTELEELKRDRKGTPKRKEGSSGEDSGRG